MICSVCGKTLLLLSGYKGGVGYCNYLVCPQETNEPGSHHDVIEYTHAMWCAEHGKETAV